MLSCADFSGEGITPAPEGGDGCVDVGRKVCGDEMGAGVDGIAADGEESLVGVAGEELSRYFGADFVGIFEGNIGKMVEPEFEGGDGVGGAEKAELVDAADEIADGAEEEGLFGGLLDKLKEDLVDAFELFSAGEV